MKFPKWKLLRMIPRLATGDPRAILGFIMVLLTFAVSRTENDWDDDAVAKVMAILDPDGDGKI